MKNIKNIFVFLIIFITILFLYNFTPVFAPIKEYLDKPKTPYVSDNGWLKVNGTKIKNEKNQDINLKGLSSHGIQWYSDILTYDNLKTLKQTWKINCFRISVYTNENGYISNKKEIKEKLIEIADDLINLDMYVIIDWHTLTDNDPNIYLNDAMEFFKEISFLYKNTPNIIYEICNEPNGNSVSWDYSIKPYAEKIIPVIRENNPNSLIIVGTPNWCKDLTPVAENPLDFENVLYSCHFYAGTHKQELRDEIIKSIENNLPIIISEFGTTDATGNGNVDIDETKKWIEFLNNYNISYINWSFSNKDESSAIIKIDYNSQNSNENNSFNNYLSESGKLVKSLFNN